MHSLAEKYLRTDRLPVLFCPGCGNGTLLQLAARAIDELGNFEDIAMVGGVGCSSWIPTYFNCDVFKTLHGRALPVATGLKLVRPDKKVVAFVGDGDGIGIGGNHLIHAANRNIDLAVIMINNNIYGMTGGQVAPTTPSSAYTSTSPYGKVGQAIDPSEVAKACGATYVARWSTAQPAQLIQSIKKAITHPGFAFVEVATMCPVQAGRYIHGSGDPTKLFNMMKAKCIPLAKAKQLPEEELAGKIVVGELVEKVMPEYTSGIQTQLNKVQS